MKGRTENALRALPFRSVYLFRPGMIVAMNGTRSKVALHNAMLTCVRTQPASAVLEPPDITRLGA